MTRIVIFGAGKYYARYIKDLEREAEIVAVVDNYFSTKKVTEDGRCIYPPSEIINMNFDFIVITIADKNIQYKLYQQLIELSNVNPACIVDYLYFLSFRNVKKYRSLNIAREFLIKFLEKEGMFSVADYDLGLTEIGIINKDAFCFDYYGLGGDLGRKIVFYGIVSLDVRCFDSYNNLYDHLLEIDQTEIHFDALLLLDIFDKYSGDEICEIINQYKGKCKCVILTLPYILPLDYMNWFSQLEKLNENIRIISYKCERLAIISYRDCDDYQSQNGDKIAIYTVTHKKYNTYGSKIHIPIQAGAAICERLGYLGDDVGDNISVYNKVLNELTAMYWIWKHDQHDIVGVEHYRRFLFRKHIDEWKEYPLTELDVTMYLNEYDVLTSRGVILYPLSVGEELRNSINNEAYEKCYRLLTERLNKDDLEAFFSVFNGFTFHPCNMMIMKKKIYDEYCAWVFPIVFFLMENMDVTIYDDYSRRVIGFFAERLFSVWLLGTRYRIKQMNFVLLES